MTKVALAIETNLIFFPVTVDKLTLLLRQYFCYLSRVGHFDPTPKQSVGSRRGRFF